MRTREIQMIAQEFNEQHARLDRSFAMFAVYTDAN
jgi:hypothetical protein